MAQVNKRASLDQYVMRSCCRWRTPPTHTGESNTRPIAMSQRHTGNALPGYSHGRGQLPARVPEPRPGEDDRAFRHGHHRRASIDIAITTHGDGRWRTQTPGRGPGQEPRRRTTQRIAPRNGCPDQALQYQRAGTPGIGHLVHPPSWNDTDKSSSTRGRKRGSSSTYRGSTRATGQPATTTER